ncbi:MAG TPA: tetratricopeptide repeat protein [Nitrospirae bacterium]|nr:tetratricopeptide repeat protein [Nitrospirota bacterium]
MTRARMSHMRRIKKSLIVALGLFLMAALAPSAHAETLGKAVEMRLQGKYSSSLRLLRKAERSLPYVKDYILYHRALVHFERGKPGDARKSIRKFLKKYPGSPARQKVRRLELDIALAGDWDKAFPVVETYIREYRDDHETRFLYAGHLEKRGRHEDAQMVYRELYVSAGDFADPSWELVDIKKLSTREKLSRAKNLYSRHYYAQAEPLLEELLVDEQCSCQEKVLRMYAQSLFRQKKYPDAVIYLQGLGDLYDAARAYIRAGDRESFHRTVLTMVAENDKDAPRLLVALAEEARRKGEYDTALEYLDNSLKLFPNEKENALWAKGWLFYRTGRLDKASEAFNLLYRKYKLDKYAYWAARSKERLGLDPSSYYRKVSENGYYSLLAMLRTGKAPKESYSTTRARIKRYRRLRRADILLSEGLLEDAAIELKAVARKTRRYKELLEIGRRLIKAGEYDVAQRLMNRVPGKKRPDDILYPIAHWEEVSQAALKHSIDPFLMLSLMREESLFDTEAFSPAGAMGLMQLMPSTASRTARAAGVVLEDKGELFLADTNIRIGTHYFSGLVRGFGAVTPGIAAYNAGASNVKKWLKEGAYGSYDEFVEDIPYRETREYVKRIMRSYYRYHYNQGLPGSLPKDPGIL